MPQTILFVVLLAASLLGQLIYFGVDTSPALIWPVTGIAVAAVFLYGYRLWPAIVAASIVSSIVNHASIPLIIGSAGANTLMILLAVYVLHTLGYDPHVRNVRSAIVLIATAFFVTMIGPLITVEVQALTGALHDPFTLAWGRGWGGRLLSVLIMTPLVTTWFTGKRWTIAREQLVELTTIFLSLIVITYLTFWTYVPPVSSWLALIFLLPFLWLALRGTPRLITLGLFIATSLAVAGTIIAHPNPTAQISQQLLADEIFMELIAALFLVIVCVVSERRVASAAADHSISELQSALKKISIEEKTKNEFIAILAHELRNPLAPIISNIELLKLDERDAEPLKLLEGIETQVRTMGRLLDDLLDISRVSNKKFELRKEVVQLPTLINHALATTRTLIESRGHELHVTMPEQELWLDVDPVRFEQILVNLLTNAAKYTAPGGRIDLTGVSDNNALTLIVRDNGCGISSEQLPTIFEPFKRETISRRSGGLGIGLSITKQLVEMHGGTITASSDGLNKGSSFTVTLPLPSQIKLPASTPKKKVASSRKKAPGSSYRILIVDDNEAAAQGLSKLLEHKGHEVGLAYNGKSALNAAELFKPEVVLLDIGLPDIDGHRVARQLRKNQNSEPLTLIALTGFGQAEDKKKAKSAGFNHHLTKPVGIVEIEAVLQTISVPKVSEFVKEKAPRNQLVVARRVVEWSITRP